RQQVFVALLHQPVEVQRERHEQEPGQRHGRGAGHEIELVPVIDPLFERELAHRARGALHQLRRHHRPRSPAIVSMASRTNAMWASSSTPSSAAPFTMSSRLTFFANPMLFIFFFTESTWTSASFFSGVTSAHATRNPDSSSHANSARAMSVSRGTPEYVACPRTARQMSSGQPASSSR